MHDTSLSTTALATLLKAGAHPNAIDHVAATEGPALAGWLGRVLRDHDQADDAVQEVWVTLLRGGWSFQPRTSDADGDARAWLRQVALRIALNRRRADQAAAQRHRVGAPSPTPAPDPIERLEADDQRAVLTVCLEQLPEPLRQAVVLRYHHDLDYRAIGVAQGCTALTARVRAWRGLQRLRAGLLLAGLVLGSRSSLAAMEGLDAPPMATIPWPEVVITGPGTGRIRNRWPVAAAATLMLAGGSAWWAYASTVVTVSPDLDAWLLQRNVDAPLVWWGKTPTGNSAASNVTPAVTPSGVPILVKTSMFHWVGRPPVPQDRPSVMRHVTWEEHRRTTGIELDGAPQVLMRQNQSASISIGKEDRYTAGYHRGTKGLEPRTQRFETGIGLTYRCQSEGDGIQLALVENQLIDLLNRHQRTAPQHDTMLTWDELQVRVTGAPVGPLHLRQDECVLVPPLMARLLTCTPSGIREEPTQADDASWLMITAQPMTEKLPPEDLQQHAPVAPGGRS